MTGGRLPAQNDQPPADQSALLAEQLATAVEAIRAQCRLTPRVAIILGSGLGALADRLGDATFIPYAAIPYAPPSTVAGHAGRLALGMLGAVPVAMMQGRFHLYEGYTPAQVTILVRILHALGADTLIATNAAGGLDPTMRAGDLLLLRDHIGLPTLAGLHPLRGPNDERLGPRFPAMTAAYDPALRALAQTVARERGVRLREGVYVMVSGPSYETPAELRFLRVIGADVVGMSTVPEVIVARHMGMRALAISVVTNVALTADAASSDPSDAPTTSHAAVLASAQAASDQLVALIEGVVARI